MLPVHLRCVRSHKQCSRFHVETVTDYRAERMRQVEQAEEASLGYATEYATYVEEHPLITFKDWLIGMRR